MPGWLGSLRELIADASPLRRLMLVVLLVLPPAALAVAYLKFNPPVYRVLFTQLSDRAGGEVIAALDQLDIAYRLSPADGTIEVPADELHTARYRLAALGLPKTDDAREDEAERSPGFGLSSQQEQQRYQRALEVDLARSIQNFEAVELARVHLALPKVSPFLRSAPPATAAVIVRLRDGARLSPEQVGSIQTLVAAAVPRMKRGDVEVLDPRGVVLGAVAVDDDASRRHALEKDLSARVLAVLTPWLGADRVNVQVTATLEPSETRQTVEQIKNVVVAGQPRPAQKTVRTTRVPEGSVRQLQAIVILGFDASANDRWKAGQLARQAIGYQAARGDSVKVYALPAAAQDASEAPAVAPQTEDSTPAPAARIAPRPAPASIPQAVPRPAPVSRPEPSGLLAWPIAAGAVLLLGWGVMRARRTRAANEADLVVEDFDAELAVARSQVMADPRVAADVVKLWMRA